MIEKQILAGLRQKAKTLLIENKVDWVAGFQEGSLKHTVSPLITNNADDTDKLVFSPLLMTNNLATFLTELKGRVAIMAKGCDSRSIVSLIQDNKVKRENLHIFGISCQGLIDFNKLKSLSGFGKADTSTIKLSKDKVIVTSGDNSTNYPVDKLLYDHCLGCELATPKEYDTLLGKAVTPPGFIKESRRQSEDLAALPADQRWQYWQKEFDKCIRCYACRSVCPACYCHRCFANENRPQWVTPAPIWQDNLFFQVIRNLHVAGRCTDCGECERACPVGIPLRSMARDTYDNVKETFDFNPGMDKDQGPLLTAYETEEAEDIML